MDTNLTHPVLLPDGLVLRRSTRQDAERLADFNGRIHGSTTGDDAPPQALTDWTYDLFDPHHPTFGEGDFTLVEDPANDKIVSCLCLINQTWAYGGIPFGVGRPELVGTDEHYRNRGLIRRQFEVVHAWSAQRGQPVQIITGIPNYYRQFGYEMAPDLGGGVNVGENLLRKLRPEQSEPFRIRLAGADDIALVMQAYAQLERREPLVCVRDADLWRYEILGKRPLNVNRTEIYVIETPEQTPVGALGIPAELWGNVQGLSFIELLPGVSYLEVMPAVLRWLWAIGQQHSTQAMRCTVLSLRLGAEHPAYVALDAHTAPRLRRYAYYTRVADIPAFLRLIRPVLEQRLAASPCAGHSGEMVITFYRSGVRIKLEKGRISAIEPHLAVWSDSTAGFPDLTFLQLLFQQHSLDELRDHYADVFAAADTHALLNAMFPKSTASIWAFG
jgi:hypothetical protein